MYPTPPETKPEDLVPDTLYQITLKGTDRRHVTVALPYRFTDEDGLLFFADGPNGVLAGPEEFLHIIDFAWDL